MEINMNKWNVINKLEDCPPLNQTVLAISDNNFYIAEFQTDGIDGCYVWELKDSYGLSWCNLFDIDAWIKLEDIGDINLSVISNEIREELKKNKEVENYVEVLLWSDNEAYLIGKHTNDVRELLNDIALVQNLNSDILPYFEISIYQITMILIDKFSCISNCINLIDTVKINNAFKFNKRGKIDDLYLLDDIFLILEPTIKNMHLFSINNDNLWENYSIWIYQDDSEGIFKKYMEDRELCYRLKRFIYYGMMNYLIKNSCSSDKLINELDKLYENLFLDINTPKTNCNM